MKAFRQSAQRKALLAYLQSADFHPSAGVIFRHVRRRFPKLSLGTVYRNLDILKQQGLVRQLDGDGKQARFDAELKPHGHFYCRLCGKVEDIAGTPDWMRSATDVFRDGRRVEEVRMEVKGVCIRCGRKQIHQGGTE